MDTDKNQPSQSQDTSTGDSAVNSMDRAGMLILAFIAVWAATGQLGAAVALVCALRYIGLKIHQKRS
ncbi:hypothetical protein [Paraburkholderia youngii]|uniref:hypothetical protein n=1 Tax=Paraburkholderia youngii TaxID=2782701 RepID=UPI003D21C734